MSIIEALTDNLNEYLKPADITIFELFQDLTKEEALVFGGAVRDGICNDTINDIDLLVLSRAKQKIVNFLDRKGFALNYKSNNRINYPAIINEPLTFEKNGVTIQLIRPVPKFNATLKPMIIDLEQFASNCDIRSCCLCYWTNGKRSFLNHDKNLDAFKDCLNKQIYILTETSLFNLRNIRKRVKKLKDKGWEILNKKVYYDLLKENGIIKNQVRNIEWN